MPGRIVIDDVAPVVSGGEYPARAVVGEVVPVCATVWREGHEAVAATLARMPARQTHLICGMLNTKDVTGYMRPLAPQVTQLHAVSIPGEKNTLPAEATRDAAQSAGIDATTADSVAGALATIAAKDPQARVLICGSLYLAGAILRENG